MVLIVGFAAAGHHAFQLSDAYPWKAAAVFAVISTVVLGFVGTTHRFSSFGPANQVTALRAGAVAMLVALIGESATREAASAAVILMVFVVLLDWFDGWLARRGGHVSDFGARFDMETDALAVMGVAVLVWLHGKAGLWVLASGMVRYVFVAAGRRFPWLARPLPPSIRRQTVCVIQMVGLTLAMVPAIKAPLAGALAAAALLALLWSFGLDVAWLWSEKATPLGAGGRSPLADDIGGLRQRAGVVAALVVLDASLTFQGIWPTPAVRWVGALSIELAVCLLAMGLVAARGRPPGAFVLRWLAALWVVLVVGRYADVMAPALYGREINLYWDLRHMSAVAAMLARPASLWLTLLVASAAVLVPLLLYVPARWAFGRVAAAMTRPVDRRMLTILAGAGIVWFAGQRLDPRWPTVPHFAKPVLETYGRQARLLATELTGRGVKTLGPAPALNSDLSRLRGADVLLIFIESYGAVSFDRPEFDAQLAASRAKLFEDIRASGRDVVSAYVESPTFGGNSWLAHISFLSGFEVRDEDADALLMAQQRDTLVTTFARRGYRTVAVMPGLQQSWPEGAFYHFDDIYDEKRLNYHGPEFGWWAIPDQFALAKMDALEVGRRPRAPLFAFLPTTSTHTPFSPTAPYQPDWARILTNRPYDDREIRQVWLDVPDWLNLGPSYVKAISYAYRSLGGYLRLRADRDLVMILIGDHQPPAAVSGEGATWEVPVHVIGRNASVLQRLIANGFLRGLRPEHPALTRMHAVVPIVLGAFGDAEKTERPSAS
jgi:phosphatidylglycerophosphate synthase